MKKEGATRDELITAMHSTTAKASPRCSASPPPCVTLLQVQAVEERAREELARQIQVPLSHLARDIKVCMSAALGVCIVRISFLGGVSQRPDP